MTLRALSSGIPKPFALFLAGVQRRIPARMQPFESGPNSFPCGGSTMYGTSQKLIAEVLGTFALIFFGAGSICTDQYLHGAGGGLGLLGIALAHGLAIGIMVSALG